MASISKPYRLVNPGRKRRSMKRNPKRRMTLKQKLHFGTARQRAAAKVSLRGRRSNAGISSLRKTKKRMKKSGFLPSSMKGLKTKSFFRSFARAKKRKNVGSILTVFNPGYKEKKKGNTMARHRRKSTKRRLAGLKAARTRKRRGNPGRRRRSFVARHRRRSNPVARTRRRRYNVRRSYRGRRRNPGMLSGKRVK